MHTYRDNGWAGLGDWLGTAKASGEDRVQIIRIDSNA
jgi:hypothetical protein